VPEGPRLNPTHDAAVSHKRSEADTRSIDAWLTEDVLTG